MPTWIQLADESLSAAKTLLAEGCHRSCASRAYYSAYASATHALLASGHRVGSAHSPNPSHSQIATMVQHNLDSKRFDLPARRDLSRRVRMLQRFRIVGDYMPVESIDRPRAIACVRDAARVREELGGSHGG